MFTCDGDKEILRLALALLARIPFKVDNFSNTFILPLSRIYRALSDVFKTCILYYMSVLNDYEVVLLGIDYPGSAHVIILKEFNVKSSHYAFKFQTLNNETSETKRSEML